jgi:hypothetical protein
MGQDKGSVSIKRASAWNSRVRAFKVLIDGSEVGSIKNGKTERFEVASGRHVCQLRIDWCTSPLVEVEVPPRGDVSLECGFHPTPWWSIFGRAVSAPHEALYLRPPESPS